MTDYLLSPKPATHVYPVGPTIARDGATAAALGGLADDLGWSSFHRAASSRVSPREHVSGTDRGFLDRWVRTPSSDRRRCAPQHRIAMRALQACLTSAFVVFPTNRLILISIGYP